MSEHVSERLSAWFAAVSKAGPLAGNHFLTIVEGKEKLHALGASTLQVGALPIRFELV